MQRSAVVGGVFKVSPERLVGWNKPVGPSVLHANAQDSSHKVAGHPAYSQRFSCISFLLLLGDNTITSRLSIKLDWDNGGTIVKVH